jgi:hypothetical protein
MLSTTGAITAHADAQGTGDIIIEARIKHTIDAPDGWHPTFWMQSATPPTESDSDENDLEGNQDTATLTQVLHGDIVRDGVGGTSEDARFYYDDTFHLWTFVVSKINTEGVKLYKDGVLWDVRLTNGNHSDKLYRILLSSHYTSDGNEPAWIAAPGKAALHAAYLGGG